MERAMNDTTRMYPRQMGNFKPEQVAIHGPYTPEKKSSGQLDFWICVILAFAVGFSIRSIWG